MSNIKIKKPARLHQSTKELFESVDDSEPMTRSQTVVDGPRRDRPSRLSKENRGVSFDDTIKMPMKSDVRAREFPKSDDATRRVEQVDDPHRLIVQASSFFGPTSSSMPHLANHTRSFWMKNVELCSGKFDDDHRDRQSPHIVSWSGSSPNVSRLLRKCLSDSASACLVTKLTIKATVQGSPRVDDRWKDLEDIFRVIRLKLGGDEVFSMGFHDGTVAGLCLFHPQQSCFLNRKCTIVDDLLEFSFDLPVPYFKFASLPIGSSTTLMLESNVLPNIDLRSVQLAADIQVTDMKLNPASTLYWPTISSIISTMGRSSDSNQNIVLQLAMPVTALIVVLDIVSRYPNEDQTALLPSDGTVTFCYEQTDVQTANFVRTPSRDWTYHALIPFSPDWNSARAPYFYMNDGVIKINFDRTKTFEADDDIIQSAMASTDRHQPSQIDGIEYRVSIVAVKPASVKSTREGHFSRQ